MERRSVVPQARHPSGYVAFFHSATADHPAQGETQQVGDDGSGHPQSTNLDGLH